jgi:hypothetical protein
LAGNGQGNLAPRVALITGNEYRNFSGILVGNIRGLGYLLNAEDQQFITRKKTPQNLSGGPCTLRY